MCNIKSNEVDIIVSIRDMIKDIIEEETEKIIASYLSYLEHDIKHYIRQELSEIERR